MYNIFVNPAIDNTTTARINYKELYDGKLGPMSLTNHILYEGAFKFL